MADSLERPEGTLPPPTEEVHLPDPSYIPAAMALGITIAVVGVVMSWVVFAVGFVIFLVTLLRWVRQTREEMAELPLGH